DNPISTLSITDPADLTVGVHLLTFSIGAGAGQVALPGAGVLDLNSDYNLLAVADDQNAIAETDADPFNEDNMAAFEGVYHVPGGKVIVHGTEGDDDLSLAAGSQLTLNVNGTPYSYATSDVTGFRVRAHDGDDTLTVASVAATAPVMLFG